MLRLKTKVPMAKPTRQLALAFVDLREHGHIRPEAGFTYNLLRASAESISPLSVPPTESKFVDVQLLSLYARDLPDFGDRNEGLLRISVSTWNPSNLHEVEQSKLNFVTEFDVYDQSHAPTFLHRTAFRNVFFKDSICLGFDLFELDGGAKKQYDKLKTALGGVPEIYTLDVLDAIPYAKVAAKLFDGLISAFGQACDDHVWGEAPTLEIEPGPGGAFLRSGIYVLLECDEDGADLGALTYRDERIDGAKRPNHLIFTLRLRGAVSASTQISEASAGMASVRSQLPQMIPMKSRRVDD